MSIFGDLLSRIDKGVKSMDESPTAHDGDWDYPRDRMLLGDRTAYVTNKMFVPVKKMWLSDKSKRLERDNKISLVVLTERENKKDRAFTIGYFKTDKDEFRTLAHLNTTRYRPKNSELLQKHRIVLQTNEIAVSDEYRGNGLAESLYKSIILSGNALICDYDQYEGARRLWRKLSQEHSDISVDVYNEDTLAIVTTNHKIVNVDYDNLDKEWSQVDSEDKKARKLLFVAYER